MNTARFMLSSTLVAGIFTVSALISPVFAEPLTLPQGFEHPGLTFATPLTFSSHSQQLVKPLTVEFGTVEEIDVQPTTKQQVAVETIVTPTPSPVAENIHPDYTTGKVLPSITPTPATNKEVSPPPTITPTDTPKPTPTPQTTIITSPSNPGGLNADVLFDMVNSYRSSKGLPAFQKDDKTCSLASSRAPEVANEVASGTMHSGLRARNLPYWNTENIISMRNETEAFNWWINDQIHREAIESNNTYSCVACSGNSCAEEFTNYQPK